MKRILLPFLALALLTSCKDYDDFDFSGKVIDVELCTNIQDVGYAIELASPSDLGGDYLADDTIVHHNVVVVYGSDRRLKSNQHVSGKIYLDNNYSKATCSYHYSGRRVKDVQEACFTKLKVD